THEPALLGPCLARLSPYRSTASPMENSDACGLVWAAARTKDVSALGVQEGVALTNAIIRAEGHQHGPAAGLDPLGGRLNLAEAWTLWEFVPEPLPRLLHGRLPTHRRSN